MTVDSTTQCKTNTILFRIERQYWQNIPLRAFSWKDAAEALTDPDAQDRLLNRLGLMPRPASIHDNDDGAPFGCARTSSMYSVRFLKSLVGMLEAAGNELSETLYVVLANLAASAATTSETVCRRAYFVPLTDADIETGVGLQHNRIDLFEDIADISQGTTGLRTWQASLGLVERLALDSAHAVSGRRILELGTGAGLVSLMCSRMGAARVYATDAKLAVLDRLRKNINLNCAFASTTANASVVTAFALDWECTNDTLTDTLAAETADGGFDTIVAADVVYSPDLVAPLSRTISRLLRASKCPDHAVCWLAATIRHEQTLASFCDCIAAEGLIAVDVTHSDEVAPEKWFFYEENSESIRIMQIRIAS